MKIADRIKESRALVEDISSDLSQIESLRYARKPERSLDVLSNLRYVLLHELNDHIAELEDHYERQLKKGGR